MTPPIQLAYKGLDGVLRAVPPAFIDRDLLAPGSYLPGPGTTGHTSREIDLEVLPPGNISMQGDDVLEGKIIQGIVYMNSARNRIKNCLQLGPLASAYPNGWNGALIQANYNASVDNAIEDVTVRPQAPGMQVNGIMGRGLTVKRVDISGCVDPIGFTRGASLTRCDSTLTLSYLHDGLYYRPIPTNIQTDGQTHSDLIQWHGGLGVGITYNRLEAFSPSADANRPDDDNGGGAPFYPKNLMLSGLMINGQSGAPTGELLFQYNWLDGGFVMINALQTSNCLTGGTWGARIWDNYFGDTTGYVNGTPPNDTPHVLSTRSDKDISMLRNTIWDRAEPLVRGAARNIRVNS